MCRAFAASRISAHSARIGTAQDLTAAGASLREIIVAGGSEEYADADALRAEVRGAAGGGAAEDGVEDGVDVKSSASKS
jgi:hypothetical protein